MITRKALEKNSISVNAGETCDLDFLMDMLNEYGFERADFVYEAGQFSIRGGIVDIYSFAKNELPYRIELDGNQVESIRTFDPETQLSVKKLTRVSIIPNIQDAQIATERVSLFEYLPANTVVWAKDIQLILDLVEKGYTKAEEIYQSITHNGHITPPEHCFERANALKHHINQSKLVEYGS